MVNRYVGAGQKLMDFVIKKIPRKKKVSPDIKSVKPTKDVKGSIKRTKSDAYTKNIDDLNKAQKKIIEGKKMMKEGQKTRKQMTGTGRAFQFKNMKSYHAIEPGDKNKFKSNIRQEKTKKFKTAKQMEKEERRRRDREGFMGGGMMGRRMGYSQGSNGKIKFDAKKSDLDKSGDLSKYEKARGMAIAKAMSKREKKSGKGKFAPKAFEKKVNLPVPSKRKS